MTGIRVDFSKQTDTGSEGSRPFIAPEAKVLLVDDINTNLRVTEGLLAPYKMQVDSCGSGTDAIAMVVENRYDLVFMDHLMPGIDGLEATAIIRSIQSEDAYCQSLPVIALTASDMGSMREFFLEKGMSDFLSKPVDIKTLDALLRKWIPKEKQKPCDEPEEPRETFGEGEIIIKGVDTKTGLSATGGNKVQYLRALATFYEDGYEKIDQINKAMLENDLPLYTIYVHALKSASASIGATRLSELSKLLENAGRNGDTLFVINFTEDLVFRLKEVLEGIGAILPRKTISEDPSSPQLFQQEMHKLRQALREMKAAEIDEALTTLKAHSWGEQRDEALRSIVRHVLLFDYEEATGLIDVLLDS